MESSGKLEKRRERIIKELSKETEKSLLNKGYLKECDM